tara:strand:- start:4565 stop:5371 length:807 start_codon:yes stop_codon:yes gene_type:complete
MSTQNSTLLDSHFLSVQWIIYKTIAKKEVLRIIRIWKMTVLPPAVNTYLFCLIFGKILGSKIGNIAGADYISYIAPGLIMNIVIVESFNNLASSVLIEKYHHAIDDLVASPAHELAILLGLVTGGIFRAFFAAGIAGMVAFGMAGILPLHPLLFFYSVIITSLVLSLLGLITGLYAQRFDEIPTIPTFILTPLAFFSGIFYDIQRLPEPWYSLSWLNPMCYMVDTFRYGAIGITYHDISLGLVVISALGVLLLFFCYYLLKIGYGLKH